MFLQKRSLLLLPAHGMAQPLLPLGCGRSTVGHPLPVHAGECSQHLSGVGFLQCRPTEYLKPGMCKAARSLDSSPNTSKVLFVTETPCSMSRAVSPKVNLIHPLHEDKAGKKQGTAWCQWPAIILKVHPPKKKKKSLGKQDLIHSPVWEVTQSIACPQLLHPAHGCSPAQHHLCRRGG